MVYDRSEVIGLFIQTIFYLPAVNTCTAFRFNVGNVGDLIDCSPVNVLNW